MKYDILKFLFSKLIFIILIIISYNIFLISKSSLSKGQAKDVFGYKAYVITTDSMKPGINAGDVVVTTKMKEEKIRIGDIITFKADGEYITHRIIEIRENEFITKGDNNNVADSYKITYEDIEGSKIIRIPFLGNGILLFEQKIYIIILIILVLLIYLYTRKTYAKRKARREKKKNEDKKFYNQNNNDSNNPL